MNGVPDDTAVAIIGMAGRFPGAANLGQYWDLLRSGTDAISWFDRDAVVAAGEPAELARRPEYVPARGLLPSADRFDWSFFGYSPAEAALIDPQQRVFLECAAEAVDDAAIDPTRFPGWIGVFAGSDPTPLSVSDDADLVSQVLGTDKDYLALRVAYKLGLRGPAVTVQTACSTSLTAVHTACQSLLGYECDVALAGGVSASLPAHRGYLFQDGGIHAPDGRCRPFDADAAGTVPSEGVGVVVLKRLADAVRDGDQVVAVIRGSAVNNDGGDKIGFTAPSVSGQREVIGLALEQSGVDPADLGYVEAHGTATRLGDPVEVEALTAAFRRSTDRTGFCHLGSVKGNIGHAGAAAGVAGLIKTALVLRHGELVPTAHHRAANPLLGIDDTPFLVTTAGQPWPTGRERLAGVSSFGIGGTNVHAVLAGAPHRTRRPEPARARLLAVSAATVDGLALARGALADRLAAEDAPRLDDTALTLADGRRRFRYRRAVAVADRADATRALRAADPAPTEAADSPTVAFLFPGQGTLRHGAGAAAYRLLPGFRATFDEVAAWSREHGVDLAPVVAERADPAWFTDTVHQQLGLFALGYALARQFADWSVTPTAMLGNSVGEYVAATLAEVWSLPDALTVVHARAEAMRATAPGRMLAVSAPAAEVASLLPAGVTVAVDGPGTAVLAGEPDQVAELRDSGVLAGWDVRDVDSERAFHSPLMAPAAARVHAAVASVSPAEPRLRLVSNRTGDWLDRAPDADYWAEHLRQPVRLGAGIATLLAGPADVLVELGPGGSMTAMLRRHPAWDPDRTAVPLLGARTDQAETALLTAIGAIWERGVDLPLGELDLGEARRCGLPPHPLDSRVPPRRPRPSRPAPGPDAELTTDAWVQAGLAGPGRHDAILVLGADRPDLAGVLAALAGQDAVVRHAADGGTDAETDAASAVAELLAGPATAPAVVHPLPDPIDAGTLDRLDALADQVAARAGARLVVVGRDLVAVLGTERTAAGAAELSAWLAARRSRPGTVSVLDLGTGATTGLPEDTGGPHAWRGRRWWTMAPRPVSVGEPVGSRRVTVVTSGRQDGTRLATALAEAGLVVAGYAGDDVRTDPLPLAAELPAALAEASRAKAAASTPLSQRPDLRERLDRFCVGLLGRFVLESGKPEPGGTVTAADLRARLDPSGMLPRFVDFVLSSLAERDWLTPAGDRYHVAPDLDSLVTAALAEGKRLGELAGLSRILEHSASCFPAVFSGAMDRVSVLYPDGEPTLLRDSLLDNQVDPSGDVAVCMDVIGRALYATHASPAGRPLRVLEIGAGRGELTWPLFDGWTDRSGLTYHFTDISPLMLRQAEQRADRLGITELTFSRYDLTRDPLEQNLAAGTFDLILAYNAVHVVPRVRDLLGDLTRLLRPAGALCVIESVGLDRWANVLWGLTPGWWDFGEDRADGIMLDAAAWRAAMTDSGFRDVETVSSGPAADHIVLYGTAPAATPPTAEPLYLPAPDQPAPPPAGVGWVVTEDGPDWRSEVARAALDPAPGAGGHHVRIGTFGAAELAGLPRLLATDGLPGSVRFTPAPPAPATPPTDAAPAVRVVDAPAADDPLRDRLARLWSEVLGVRTVADRDDFFALGGESLMAVHFMGRLRAETGIHVAPASFTRSSTFGGLLALARRAAPEVVEPTQAADPDLVVFREGGPHAPLFLAAPAAGTTVSYQALAALLDDDRPVYGIEPVPPPAGVVPRVEDIAAHHVRAIRRVRPHGPYLLGGWSFGAVVAHEMAQQLIADGERVELVVGIDGYPPNTGGRPISDSRGFLAVGLWYQASATLRIGTLGGLVRGAPDLRAVFTANIRAMWRYRPRPLPCAVLVLKTRLDPLRGRWLRRSLAGLYRGGVRVRPVPGSHWTLLDEPHVRQIAAEVRQAIAGRGTTRPDQRKGDVTT